MQGPEKDVLETSADATDNRRYTQFLESLEKGTSKKACAARDVGHVSAALLKGQVQAGAEFLPPILERLDSCVAVADLKRCCIGGGSILRLVLLHIYRFTNIQVCR